MDYPNNSYWQAFWRDLHTGARRKHTFRRFLNRALIELGIRLRIPYAFALPHYAVIEVTNMCNLRCPLCPTGQGVPGRIKGRMEFKDFKKIIDVLGSYLYGVRLENWGEPLLNDNLPAMVAYLKEKGIHSAFNSNLLLLSKQGARELVKAGLNHIKVSFDGINQEDYARYRRGGDFHLLLDNIACLVEARKELGSGSPFIELQYLVMKHNQGGLGQAQELAKQLGVDCFTRTALRLGMRDELFMSREKARSLYKDWIPDSQPASGAEDFPVRNRQKKKNNFCAYLWNTVVVNYDGSIVPCCSVYDPKYDFGNIFKDGFKKVWNGPKYTASRRLIGRSKLSNESTVCVNCFKQGVLK